MVPRVVKGRRMMVGSGWGVGVEGTRNIWHREWQCLTPPKTFLLEVNTSVTPLVISTRTNHQLMRRYHNHVSLKHQKVLLLPDHFWSYQLTDSRMEGSWLITESWTEPRFMHFYWKCDHPTLHLPNQGQQLLFCIWMLAHPSLNLSLKGVQLPTWDLHNLSYHVQFNVR